MYSASILTCCAVIFSRFFVLSRRELVYYTSFLLFCQYLFSRFFENFRISKSVMYILASSSLYIIHPKAFFVNTFSVIFFVFCHIHLSIINYCALGPECQAIRLFSIILILLQITTESAFGTHALMFLLPLLSRIVICFTPLFK